MNVDGPITVERLTSAHELLHAVIEVVEATSPKLTVRKRRGRNERAVDRIVVVLERDGADEEMANAPAVLARTLAASLVRLEVTAGRSEHGMASVAGCIVTCLATWAA